MKKKLDLYAPIAGKLIALSQVNDEIFSSGVMGVGFGIIPDTDSVYEKVSTPIDGKIMVIANTKHALYITNEDKIECLIHVGIDTAELSGEPFEITKGIMDSVKVKDTIMMFSPAKILECEKETVVIVVFTNAIDKIKQINLVEEEKVSLGQVIGTLEFMD